MDGVTVQTSERIGRSHWPARGSLGTLVSVAMVAVEGVGLFVLAGVYASMAGLSVRAASAAAAAVTIVGLWPSRHRLCVSGDVPPDTAAGSKMLVAAVVLAGPVALALPNDVYNTDIAKQVASVEHVKHYDTLVIPGFYASHGTKYDGWTFLHASVSVATGLEPRTLVRYSKLFLLPFFAVLLYLLIRALDLNGTHLVPAIILMLAFSGDSFRLISLGGPRSLAYAFQVAGLICLASAVKAGHRAPLPAYAVRAAILFGVSGITHLFFSLTSALIVATTWAVVSATRFRREALPACLVLLAVFGLVVGPYSYIKRQAVPVLAEEPQAPLVTPTSDAGTDARSLTTDLPRSISLGDMLSWRWGEYGSLVPFFLAPLFLIAGPRWKQPQGIFLYLVLFAAPVAMMFVPPVHRVVLEVITDTRIHRVVPLSPAVAAIVVYGWGIRAVTGRWKAGARRVLAVLAFAVSLISLAPSAKSTWLWYAAVYPSTRWGDPSKHPFISVGSLLRLGTEVWPPVLASSREVALRLAAVTNRPVYFYRDEERRYATRADVFIDEDQELQLEWAFVVEYATDPQMPVNLCAERLYVDTGLLLCATERGRSIWNDPSTTR